MTARSGTRPAGGARRGTERHVPVLLPEVLSALAPGPGETFVDATFGAGGYARAILESAPDCRVLAIDRDPIAIAAGQELARAYAGRLVLIEGRFGELDRITAEAGFSPVHGVALDIGVSSMQIDNPARGFSFQEDGPLDMRMSPEGPTAADVVNNADEARLADILFHLGEERGARAIARRIAMRRKETPFTRTRELALLVIETLGREKIAGRHAATRTFQALRIYVNDELGELARGLAAAERVLVPGGRLAVVTFHSLEDRLVKRSLRLRGMPAPAGSRHVPPGAPPGPQPSFRSVNRRPISPDAEEISANPRARSAKLRFAVRTDAPAWPSAEGDNPGLPALPH